MARVAIIGASGIGKHHAKWWALEGAEVAAFAGRTSQSVAQTAEALQALFGFSGKGFTSPREMLETVRPDFVDICSPPDCHAEHVRLALAMGCTVLCEKPFVYEPGTSRPQLIETARSLLAAAPPGGIHLCTQYVPGVLEMRRWMDQHGAGGPLQSLEVQLEAPAKNRGPGPKRIWVDLSPHPWSMLFALEPEAAVDWENAKIHFDGYTAEVWCQAAAPGGANIQVHFLTRNRTEGPSNIRRVAVNGQDFNVFGHQGEDGVYAARMETPWGAAVTPDFMHLLIQRILAGAPQTADPGPILAGLDAMLRVLESAAPR